MEHCNNKTHSSLQYKTEYQHVDDYEKNMLSTVPHKEYQEANANNSSSYPGETHLQLGEKIIHHRYKYDKLMSNRNKFFRNLHALDYEGALDKVVKHIHILQDHRNKTSLTTKLGYHMNMTTSMQTAVIALVMLKPNSKKNVDEITNADIEDVINDVKKKCAELNEVGLSEKLAQISYKKGDFYDMTQGRAGYCEYLKAMSLDVQKNSVPEIEATVPLANHSEYAFDKIYQFNNIHLQIVKSTEFRTHISDFNQDIHATSEAIFRVSNWNAQNLAYMTNPTPGYGKDSALKKICEATVTPFVTLFTAPVSLLTGIVALPMRAAVHKYRPLVSYIENVNQLKESFLPETTAHKKILTKNNPLKIRSHNLGFTPAILAIAADLIAAEVRAKQLINFINNDPEQPDIISFQETFHEDATKILMEGIKESYPYIIHNVLPTVNGLNSGAAFASKYPIKSVEFKRYVLMAGFQALTPRGTCRVEFEIPGLDTPFYVYSAHTQALVGEDYSLARFTQINDIDNLMKQNREKGEQLQVLLGDFNTSAITAWGEDNIGTNQAEREVYGLMQEKFHDIFLQDHEVNGTRKNGTTSHYLDGDNKKMNIDAEEPKGSWSRGPFQDSKLVELEMTRNRWANGRQQPVRPDLVPSKWGTPEWFKDQPADTARFDYIVFPKENEKHSWRNQLAGTVEIRRVHLDKQAQSGASDHLPVDARIWIKNDLSQEDI
ncbi:MAG: sphingomyelin phosphodiesterase 3-like [Solimicrobium sp.]|jgi:endonuclease/exonuclease/phosphatase family metal-dependent hydrolase|nr:sphingomyelin phosphodiesterase 3-like [Solimicrobium sp.]